MDPAVREKTNDEIRNIKWIWAALIGSLGMYVLIAHLLKSIVTTPSTDLPRDLLRNIFFSIAGVEFLVAFIIRKSLFKLALGISDSTERDIANEAHLSQLVTKYKTIVLLTSALSEGIAVFGFILFLLIHDLQSFYILIVLSAIALFFHRPRKEELERLISGSPF